MFEADQQHRPASGRQIETRWHASETPMDRLAASDNVIAPPARKSDLDKTEARELHSRLMGFFTREIERQSENREQMSVDHDFYDGIQRTEAQMQQIISRGQTPLTFNVISTTINWMLGTERRARTDHKVLPRREDASKSAERKSELLKYLSDVNQGPHHWSRAFSDCVIGGMGWIEDGVSEDDEKEAIYRRYESWRNVLHDSAATESDLSDARYIFRSKWVDLDVALEMFPDRAPQIRLAATSSLSMRSSLSSFGDEAMDSREEDMATQSQTLGIGQHAAERPRVRLIEAWYRANTRSNYVVGGQFAGELFDARSPGHMAEYEAGEAEVAPRARMRVHVAIMTEFDLLFHAPSPYRHNRFPFTPIFCYLRDRDNMPYGLVRQMRDAQVDINDRATKALWILNSNKTVMDEGAVKDIKEFASEVNRADAVIVKRPGKELILNADRGMDQAHIDMMSRSMQMVQSMTGITDESLGRTTNAQSGKAIIARQDQGSLATAPIFDRLRLAKQVAGEKQLSLLEQFMSADRQIRITDTRGNPAFVKVNDGLPENDIVATKADYVIAEADFAATIRQAQVAELLDLMSKLASTAPELVAGTLDLLIEKMDVPNVEEIVRRVRQITGQADPDEDPRNPSPETMQRQEQAAKEQQYTEAMAMAQLEEQQAKAEKAAAEAGRISAEQARIKAEVAKILAQTEGETIDTRVRALEAAAAILAQPAGAPVADSILASAGAAGPAQQPQPMPMPAQQTAQPLPPPPQEPMQ